MTIEFASPAWLALGVLIPLFWIWLRPPAHAGLIHAYVTSRQTPREGSGPTSVVDLLPTTARAASVFLLVVALAEPQMVRELEEPVTEGVGIAIAIDLSTSMWAQDMARSTSRLDAAKSTIRTFLSSRSDDVGLVTFAGESLTRVPLTDDPFIVDAAVAGLDVGLLVDGTDIAGAIAAGAGLLRDTPHGSKVLILVTDGAHNKAGLIPAVAARAAAAYDVKIYPIAIGQEQPDNDGMETVLTQAARISGGRYFRATDVAALETIYQEIDRLTTPSELLETRIETEPLRWLFLLGAAAGLLLAVGQRGSRWGVLP